MLDGFILRDGVIAMKIGNESLIEVLAITHYKNLNMFKIHYFSILKVAEVDFSKLY
jgi:hypothetical protein